MTDHLTTPTDERVFRERGFGLRIGFGQKPVLLVVDMIRAFTDSGRPLGANLDAQIESTKAIVHACRQTSVPIIFSTVRYDGRNLADAGIWRLKQKGLETLAADLDGSEIDPRLDPQSSDALLVKKYASCFFGTDLTTRLVANGADTLIIVGCTTSGCVRMTAVDAVQSGFRPMVVREAVGDRSAKAHEQSLFDLDAKYADVVGLADTLKYLRERPMAQHDIGAAV